MRAPAKALAALGAAAILAAGCGGSGSDSAGTTESASAPPLSAAAEDCGAGGGAKDLKAVGLDCGAALAVAREWSAEAGCEVPAGASRSACGLRDWRCLSVRSTRGIAVSCARRGRSIAFFADR
jgi:hypothetical protein